MRGNDPLHNAQAEAAAVNGAFVRGVSSQGDGTLTIIKESGSTSYAVAHMSNGAVLP